MSYEKGLAKITKNGSVWILENDSLKSAISFINGSIQMTSFYNKSVNVEYLTGSGDNHLFYYKIEGNCLYANDCGWTSGTDTISDIQLYNKTWGKKLEVMISRATPININVKLIFEIYNGNSGLRYYTTIKNNSAAFKCTITESDIIALNFPNNSHTIYYVPNMKWTSTKEGLSNGRNCINVYNTGDGWALSPEINFRTGSNSGTPFGTINAWSGISNVKFSTDPNAVQLVLFPDEEFEYLAINMTVFKGDSIDGRMAVQQHFRNRYKYNKPIPTLSVNDWFWYWQNNNSKPDLGSVEKNKAVWQGNRTDSFYRNAAVPQAVAAGFDRICVDEYWNGKTDEDGTVPVSDFTSDMPSLADYVTSNGLKFGFWFSLTGRRHGEGRDIADQSHIDYKINQVENILISQYKSTWQQLDLLQLWQNPNVTSYSHPSDSVYRKNVKLRDYQNYITHKYPDFMAKVTCEIDAGNTDDKNNGLIHLADNGLLCAHGELKDVDIRTAFDSFGYFPLESVFLFFAEDYIPDTTEWMYTTLASRESTVYAVLDNWKSAIPMLRQFNDWRKNPRISSILSQMMCPVYTGPDFDETGPWVWMYTDESKSKALLLASGGLESGIPDSANVNLRWLDDNKTYLVEDISMRDDGTYNYCFKTRSTGAQLKSAGFNVEFDSGTSKGKAYWIQEDNGTDVQVLYADGKIYSYSESTTGPALTVSVTGTADSTGKVIVYDSQAGSTFDLKVTIDVNGNGSTIYCNKQ